MLRCPPVEQVATTFFYLITFSTSRDEAKVSFPLKQALSPLVNFFSQLTLPRGDKKKRSDYGSDLFSIYLIDAGWDPEDSAAVPELEGPEAVPGPEEPGAEHN